MPCKNLPEDYREVIILRQLEGLSFPDVARRMGRTEDSVKNVWLRAWPDCAVRWRTCDERNKRSDVRPAANRDGESHGRPRLSPRARPGA